MLKSMQKQGIPGFTIKDGPRETRVGARLQAVRADARGSDSEASSRVHSARSTASEVAATAADEEREERSWLEQEKEKEVHRAAVEEKENKILTRKLNLKLSKYKVELHEANKLLGSLVVSSQETLRDSPAIADLALGLVDDGRSRSRETSAKGKRDAGPATIDEISNSDEGLLGNVRLLTAATMKIAIRKKRLEEVVDVLRKEYIREKKQFEDHLRELTIKMNELRLAKENAEFNLKDTRITFEGQIKTLEREAEIARERLQVLEVVNVSLKQTVRSQEGELLEVPRLEEAYLRKARSIVQHKEYEVLEKTVSFKKVQKEVEHAEFWHGKAKALDAEGQAKDRRISELSRQLHQLHHKYVNIQGQWEREKEIARKKGKHVVDKKAKTQTSEDEIDQDELACMNMKNSGDTFGDEGSPISLPQTKQQKHASRSGKRDKEKKDLGFEIGNTANVELKLPLEVEVERLKRDNQVLRDKLERSNTSLSAARAYPLFTLGLDPSVVDMGEEGELRNGKKSEQQVLDELFDSDEDKADLMDLQPEERLIIENEKQYESARRIERALTVSSAYKLKLKQLRAARGNGVQHLKKLRDDN